jgi:hypothetical protein
MDVIDLQLIHEPTVGEVKVKGMVLNGLLDHNGQNHAKNVVDVF